MSSLHKGRIHYSRLQRAGNDGSEMLSFGDFFEIGKCVEVWREVRKRNSESAG